MSPSPPGKTVLITGCSSHGIGAALALALAKQGVHTVFATARDPSKIPSDLSTLSNVHVLALDVTSAESVRAAVQTVQHTLEQGQGQGQGLGPGLDVLVNNAGVGYTMPLLDVDIDDQAKKLYDTNVWGCLRVVQGFADLLIQAKQPRRGGGAAAGRVVMMSSVGGVTNTPWIGTYTSSKAALNTLAATLRLELAPFGVSVVAVMLGRARTSFHGNEPAFRLPEGSRYAPIENTIARWARGEPGPRAGNVEALVAELVEDVVGGCNGTADVWKGAWAGTIRILSRWLPVWMMDYAISQDQGLDELARGLQRSQ